MSGQKFVTIDSLVSAVLLGIGDETNKRYEVKATQWIIDTIRRIHVSYSPYYKEERVYFDNEDLFTIDYPVDAIKILSVGIYREDVFWSFTKRADISILATAEGWEEYDYESNEGMAVPPKGVGYGAQANNIAFWADDPQHCRIVIRMFSYYRSMSSWLDRTQWLKDKGMVLRYKSTGVDCNGDVCIPVEARDLVVNKVIYEFVRRGWGIQMTNYNVELQRQELDSLQAEYEALLYEPHHFWEIKDSIYGSLNVTARR